jgi:hypothetical protein
MSQVSHTALNFLLAVGRAPNFKSGEPSTIMEELLLDAAAEASCDRQSTQDKSKCSGHMTAFNATCRLKDTDEVLTVFPVPNIAFDNGATLEKYGRQ